MPPDIKSLAIEYIERVWNHGELAALDELTTAEFTYQLGDQPPRDRLGMQQFIAATRLGFPDWRVEALAIVCERDTVAVRWAGTVTHGGVFHGIAPTGRRLRVSGINLYQFAEGKIAQEWEQMDSLGILIQLGALPRPA
jgi:predicted ester cyclase